MAAAFRPKKLDLGGYVSAPLLRDHLKRKTFAQHEPQRYATCLTTSLQPILPKAYSR